MSIQAGTNDARTLGQKRRLGRGLDGMLPAAPAPTEPKASATAYLEELAPNRKQPRHRFDEASLRELADSIRAHGVLEPILVRKLGPSRYEIIAGERRWRAAQLAGLKELPIYVRDLDEAKAFEASIVENLQREDLNPIEAARAFERLINEFDHTQESLAERIGKSRSTITNALRLLMLPEPVLALLEDGALSEGHGRALLQAPTPESVEKIARKVVADKLSVRDTERLARFAALGEAASEAPRRQKSANVKDLERRLSYALGSRVRVEESATEGKGKVVVRYTSLEELDKIVKHFTA